MAAKLSVVDYSSFCSEYGIDYDGVTRFFVGDDPCVIIGPNLVSIVLSVVEYKFKKIPIHNDFEGLLAKWGPNEVDERNRFFMMCAYVLRGTLPEMWELSSHDQ